MELTRAKRQQITKFIKKWDLCAKLSPICFLVAVGILWAGGVITLTTGFYVALVAACLVVLFWWIWAIYTIRYLVKVLLRADVKLNWVTNEFVQLKEEIKKSSEKNKQ